MPAPLDADLRLRVVQTYENGDSTVEDVASRFCVGTASLKRWVWQWRATGSVEPKPPHRGRPPKVTAECDAVLRELVAAQPDAYCWELGERLEAHTGVRVDEDTIGRALTRLGLTRKKEPQSLGAAASGRDREADGVPGDRGAHPAGERPLRGRGRAPTSP